MPEYLGLLMQTALLLLVIAIIVVLVQIVLILTDVRQVTKRIRRISNSLQMVEYFFDSDDLKSIIKNLRKMAFGVLEIVARSIRRMAGGEKSA